MSNINRGFKYTNRKGIEITAGKALDWLNRPGEEGEEREPITVEEVVCRYYFREKALADDRARKSTGALASRLYSPALDSVDDSLIPAKLEKAVDEIAEVQVSRKAPRVRKAAK